MRQLFIDTWGWLSLRDRREERHQDVRSLYHEVRKQKGTLITTDYVLDETLTLLFRRLPFPEAHASLVLLDRAIQEGYLQLIWITHDRFEQAKRLRLTYQDKPRISFTDFASMVVMDEFDLSEILTEDAHFTHVGMGFFVVPEMLQRLLTAPLVPKQVAHRLECVC